MFFEASKLLSLVLLPFPFFYFVGLFGLLAARSAPRGKKGGRPVVALLIYLVFGFISTDYAANRLLRFLEDRFPVPSVAAAPKADMVFVLGGMSNTLAKVDAEPQFTDGVDRLLMALELFRSGRASYFVLTGKSSLLDHKGPAESQDLRDYLVRHGIAADRILIETESRNTAENFLAGLKLAKEHNLHSLFLVTSAFHMYRSMATLDRVRAEHYAGEKFEVIPFPCDYRSDRIESGIEAYVPSAHAMFKSSIALKEYMGLVGYAARGYISWGKLAQDFD
jgi:uncharacterized SAM-binding protein YcdF (DUF218 family)